MKCFGWHLFWMKYYSNDETMAIDLQSISGDISRHGEITLQPLFPKDWKKTMRELSFTLPNYRSGSVAHPPYRIACIISH